jgi:two-component system OmpR family sensor kinase
MGMLARAKSESERLAAMDTLSAGVQRAIRLIEQMLALARQEPRAAVARTAVRLDELAREVVGELVPLADLRHIDLGVAAAQAAEVSADADALRTLLRNLIDNAVRYTAEYGRVDVSVESLAAPAGAVRVTVSDNGPGIEPAERARVFDRFYRRAGTAQPGSGLGLAIVKSIADAHGATLQLADGLDGRGVAVAVTFPASAAAPLAP